MPFFTWEIVFCLARPVSRKVYLRGPFGSSSGDLDIDCGVHKQRRNGVSKQPIDALRTGEKVLHAIVCDVKPFAAGSSDLPNFQEELWRAQLYSKRRPCPVTYISSPSQTELLHHYGCTLTARTYFEPDRGSTTQNHVLPVSYIMRPQHRASRRQGLPGTSVLSALPCYSTPKQKNTNHLVQRPGLHYLSFHDVSLMLHLLRP